MDEQAAGLEAGSDSVRVFHKDGQVLARWGGTGSEMGRFRSPSGIAVDAQGSVYVADAPNSRIQRLPGLATRQDQHSLREDRVSVVADKGRGAE